MLEEEVGVGRKSRRRKGIGGRGGNSPNDRKCVIGVGGTVFIYKSYILHIYYLNFTEKFNKSDSHQMMLNHHNLLRGAPNKQKLFWGGYFSQMWMGGVADSQTRSKP